MTEKNQRHHDCRKPYEGKICDRNIRLFERKFLKRRFIRKNCDRYDVYQEPQRRYVPDNQKRAIDPSVSKCKKINYRRRKPRENVKITSLEGHKLWNLTILEKRKQYDLDNNANNMNERQCLQRKTVDEVGPEENEIESCKNKSRKNTKKDKPRRNRIREAIKIVDSQDPLKKKPKGKHKGQDARGKIVSIRARNGTKKKPDR